MYFGGYSSKSFFLDLLSKNCILRNKPNLTPFSKFSSPLYANSSASLNGGLVKVSQVIGKPFSRKSPVVS